MQKGKILIMGIYNHNYTILFITLCFYRFYRHFVARNFRKFYFFSNFGLSIVVVWVISLIDITRTLSLLAPNFLL